MVSLASVSFPWLIGEAVSLPVSSCPCNFVPLITYFHSIFVSAVGFKVGALVPNISVRSSTFLRLGCSGVTSLSFL